ncbi:MAG: glycosyltransferase [Pseudomonadota bacterium]
MLSVIVPTVNEATNLKILLPQLKNECDEIVVVDDASTDETVQVANSFECKVIQRPGLLGCGTAVYDGVKAASHEVVAIMDADFSHPLKMLRCRSLVEQDLVDIIKFSRFAAGGGMEDKFRYYLFRIYNLIMSCILGVRSKEITGGFIISKKECFNYQKQGNTEWSLEYMRHNRFKRIAEIPYFYATRKTGTSKNTDLKRIFLYLISAIKFRFTIS